MDATLENVARALPLLLVKNACASTINYSPFCVRWKAAGPARGAFRSVIQSPLKSVKAMW